MTDRPVLQNPVLHVIMADGSEWEAQAKNPDVLRWESTATRHKWGGMETFPMRFTTFLAWRAGIREGHIPSDLTWEEFSENGPRVADEVRTLRGEAVDPTQPVAGTD